LAWRRVKDLVDKRSYEKALAKLRDLLAIEDAGEDQYQDWFQNHPVAHQCFGYDDVRPQVILEKYDGKSFKPDFLAHKPDCTWEIFELKRPDTQILRDVARRQTFYAEFNQHVAQCAEYQEFFEDRAHRDAIRVRYAIDVTGPPHAVLVAGRDENLEKPEVHKILSRYSRPIDFKTYDDVAGIIDKFRLDQYGRFENLPGVSLHLFTRIPSAPTDKWFIFDVGVDENRNRVSLFVDHRGALVLRMLDDTGTERRVEAAPPISRFDIGNFVYISVEVGVGEDDTILATQVDGITETSTLVERQRVALTPSKHFVIGSDVRGVAETCLDVAELIEFSRTLKFHERLDLRDYFRAKYHQGIGQYVEYRGNRFHHSTGHPNFP
jgi:hypothetical protein